MFPFVSTFYKSAKYAARGLVYVFKREANFRFQTFAGAAVLAAAFLLPLARWEQIIIILVVLFVLVLELLNTMVEHIVDIFKPRIHHYAESIKDIIAAAVLLASLGALAVGLLIFVPHLM